MLKLQQHTVTVLTSLLFVISLAYHGFTSPTSGLSLVQGFSLGTLLLLAAWILLRSKTVSTVRDPW